LLTSCAEAANAMAGGTEVVGAKTGNAEAGGSLADGEEAGGRVPWPEAANAMVGDLNDAMYRRQQARHGRRHS
jgi:hypothetical protein